MAKVDAYPNAIPGATAEFVFMEGGVTKNATPEQIVGTSDIIHYVDTIYDLRQIVGSTGKQAVQVLGYYAVGDGGGGPVRYWDESSTCTDDGGACIDPVAPGAGRWVFPLVSPIDVKDYGAKCDGLTDDTLPIQTALNAAGKTQSSAGGIRNVIATESGSFSVIIHGATVVDQLVLPMRVALTGDNWRSSIIIQKAGANKHLIIVSNPLTTERVEVKNLYLNGNKTNQVGAWDGIYFESTALIDRNHNIDNVFVTNCSGNGISLVGTGGESRITNSITSQNGGHGVYVAVYDTMITNIVSWMNGGDGFRVIGSASYLANCKAWRNGITAQGVGFYLLTDALVYSNLSAQHNYGHGFRLGGIGHSGDACLADGNGKRFDTDSGYIGAGFSIAALTNSRLDLVATDFASGGSGTVSQSYGVLFNGSENAGNSIDLVASSSKVAPYYGNPISGEKFTVNGHEWKTITNNIRNSIMTGAIAGSPGTMPTNWGNNIPSGLTRTISKGKDAGLDYVDIRFAGTVTVSSVMSFDFETATQIAAAVGQTWTNSAYVALVGGTWPVRSVDLGIFERSGAGALLSTSVSDIRSLTAGPTLYRVSHTRTTTDGTIAFVQPTLRSDTIVGDVVDFTIRIAGVQMEQVDSPSIFVPTTNSAITVNLKK